MVRCSATANVGSTMVLGTASVSRNYFKKISHEITEISILQVPCGVPFVAVYEIINLKNKVVYFGTFKYMRQGPSCALAQLLSVCVCVCHTFLNQWISGIREHLYCAAYTGYQSKTESSSNYY